MEDMKIRFAATVGELREALKDLPSDTKVMQALDEAGNRFLPLMGAGACLYSLEEDMMLPVEDSTLLPNEPHSVFCLWPARDWQHAQIIAEARRTLSQKK